MKKTFRKKKTTLSECRSAWAVALEKVIELAGSEKAVAMICGVTQQTVSAWRTRKHREKRIPEKYVTKLVKEFPEKLTAHELRPDIFDENFVYKKRDN